MDTTTIFKIMGRLWKGWFDRCTRYFVDVPVNPLWHAIGTVVEWFSAPDVKRDLTSGPGETS